MLIFIKMIIIIKVMMDVIYFKYFNLKLTINYINFLK